MRPVKKNGFLTFIASLIPGAAHMYMGLMKYGVSLMSVFVLFVAAAGNLRGLWFMAAAAMILWFYSFFHARNLASMDAEVLSEYEDRYFWEELLENGGFTFSDEKMKKMLAWVLIITGALIMWGYVSGVLYSMIPGDRWTELYGIINRIPELVISVLLVVGGIRMVKGREIPAGAFPGEGTNDPGEETETK